MVNDFDAKTIRSQLDALRAKFGADTPAGHRCSNLIEQLKSYQNIKDLPTRWTLAKNISQSVEELARLSAA